MKIMYLLFSYTVGGTERLVTEICNEVVKKHEVHLYIVNDLVDENLIKTLDNRINIFRQNRSASSGDKLKTLLLISKYIKRNQIELVHCNSFNAPNLLLLSKMCNFKTKIVHTIHGMGQYEKLSKLQVKLRNIICDGFIGISDCVKVDMISHGAKKNKTVMIYNGINTDKYLCAIKRESNQDEIVLGCVARFMPQIKGQDVLVKAMGLLKKDFPNIRCRFAGGVSKEQQSVYEEILHYIEKNELTENIEFVGSIQDVPLFLNELDICVVPSRTEGFGLALVEALAMGVPCVASDIEGPAEIVRRMGVGELFESENEKALAQTIKSMIQKMPELRDQVWNCREDVLNTFGIREMCELLIQYYTSLIQ